MNNQVHVSKNTPAVKKVKLFSFFFWFAGSVGCFFPVESQSFAHRATRAVEESKQTGQVLLHGSRKRSREAGLIWTSPWRRFNRQIDLIQRLCRLVSLFFKGLKSVEGGSGGLCTHVWEMWKADCWVLIEGLWLATMETGFECAKSEGRWKMEQRCLCWLPLSLGWSPCRIRCALRLGNFSELPFNHLHVSCRTQQLTFVMWVIPPVWAVRLLFLWAF